MFILELYHLQNVCISGVVPPSYLTATGWSEISFQELQNTGYTKNSGSKMPARKPAPADPTSNGNPGLEALAAYLSRSEKPQSPSGFKIM